MLSFKLVLNFLRAGDLVVQVPLADVHTVLDKHRAALMEIELNTSLLRFKEQISHPFIHNRSYLVFGGHLAANVDTFYQARARYLPREIGAMRGEQNTSLCLTGASKKCFKRISAIS